MALGLKGTGSLKGELESKGMRVNVKETKMKLNIENSGKVTIEDKFPCAVCRKGIGSNSILSQFCRCRVHKRCSGIRIKPPSK